MFKDKKKLANVLRILSPILIVLGAVMILMTLWSGIAGATRTALQIIGIVVELFGVFCMSVQAGLSAQFAKAKSKK
jgi:uncharacterized membrane protein